jgi:hypothetical protein
VGGCFAHALCASLSIPLKGLPPNGSDDTTRSCITALLQVTGAICHLINTMNTSAVCQGYVVCAFDGSYATLLMSLAIMVRSLLN